MLALYVCLHTSILVCIPCCILVDMLRIAHIDMHALFLDLVIGIGLLNLFGLHAFEIERAHSIL